MSDTFYKYRKPTKWNKFLHHIEIFFGCMPRWGEFYNYEVMNGDLDE